MSTATTSRTPGGQPPASTTSTRVPRTRAGIFGGRMTPWLFLIVPLAFLIVLTYVPVANMLWYSVTSWDGLDEQKEFVGLANYIEIFTRPELFQVFFVSLYYLAGAIAQLVIALFFATLLSFKTRFRTLFKGIIFFPYLINGVAIGLMFLYFFRPDGTLDALLAALGVTNTPQWLGDSRS
jgi:multiple sugar transport system permease protein